MITSNNKAAITHLGLMIGEDVLLLIDAYHESKAEELYQAIQKISDKPLKYVINTHSHPDHTGGNTSSKFPSIAVLIKRHCPLPFLNPH